ncbi:MAG: S41 family peptidase [Candidatus Thermoplasmatota archaeon]|nr:S41 family peptidase [Candidatus Thermoplasmatota archaeon]MCL5889305.1 S41 family peptidase [Candidatus Thermoplasmatota archaeon]
MSDQSHVESIGPEKRAWLIGLLHRNISEYFAHWKDSTFTREKLDDVYFSWIKEGIHLNDRLEFVTFLQRCVAKLRNGHSWCYDQYASLHLTNRSKLGFLMEKMDDQWVVVKSEVPVVKTGFIVKYIDGKMPDEWMESLDSLIGQTKIEAREREWQYLMPFIWKSDSAILSVIDNADSAQKIEYSPPKLNTKVVGSVATSSIASSELKRLEGTEVGYLPIHSFSEPQFEESALEHLRLFSNARAIIIDVRGNGGGNTPEKLIAALMDRPRRWWTETCPNVAYLKKRHSGDTGSLYIFEDGTGGRWESDFIQSGKCIFTGNIIILIDRNTGSAAEDFVMPFKDTGRAIIIGESSNGSTGQPIMWSYDSINFGIGSIRAYLPSGGEFEGVGILPDIIVKKTRDDIITGRDPVLERAINILS